MTQEEVLIVAIPLTTLIVSTVVAYLSGKAQSRTALTTLGVIWVGFTAAMFFGMQNATGWDGLGYAAALIGLAAPAGAGFGLGGLTGWLKGRNAIHA